MREIVESKEEMDQELSIGTNLVFEHIEELKEEDQLSRENLEKKVEQNPRLSLEDLSEILEDMRRAEILKNNYSKLSSI